MHAKHKMNVHAWLLWPNTNNESSAGKGGDPKYLQRGERGDQGNLKQTWVWETGDGEILITFCAGPGMQMDMVVDFVKSTGVMNILS